MISFIIPAKNEAGYIGKCLRSILEQTFSEDFEIVVVDNGSSDGTRAVVSENYPQAKIVEEKTVGTSAARQRGFLEAKGEWLIFLDADVRLPNQHWLSRVAAKIRSTPLVALSSHYRYYGQPAYKNFLQLFGTFVFIYPWIFFVSKILRHSTHMIGGMMVIKRTALETAGGFDTSTEFFGDEALVAKKLFLQGEINVSPKFWVWTSARRFQKQGMFRSLYGYVFNYFWTLFTGKPYQTGAYKEHR